MTLSVSLSLYLSVCLPLSDLYSLSVCLSTISLPLGQRGKEIVRSLSLSVGLSITVSLLSLSLSVGLSLSVSLPFSLSDREGKKSYDLSPFLSVCLSLSLYDCSPSLSVCLDLFLSQR